MLCVDPAKTLYTSWVSACWVAGLASAFWWAGLYFPVEQKRPQIKLVAVNGRLLGA